MLTYPQIDPVAFEIGPLKIHWYGLMYIIGILIAWGLATWRARKPQSHWDVDQVSDLIFYCALGVVLGGRIGYMLFYDFPNFIANPLVLFKVWQGGMSFHGGLLGVMLAMWLYGRHIHKTFFDVADFIAPVVPLGLAAGRLGNFINGELFGKVTTMPWGMVFPHGGPLPRHPSQLYEFLLEGVLLFAILWIYSSKPRPKMAVSAMFLFWYGIFRFVIEFYRVPDPQYGYLAFGWLTMGQILSLPMMIFGIIWIWRAYQRQRYSW